MALAMQKQKKPFPKIEDLRYCGICDVREYQKGPIFKTFMINCSQCNFTLAIYDKADQKHKILWILHKGKELRITAKTTAMMYYKRKEPLAEIEYLCYKCFPLLFDSLKNK